MKSQKIADMLADVLKTDWLAAFRKQAEQGDELAQIILGDIYFYGINTDEKYWENVNRSVALAKYSKRSNIQNYAFVCSCDDEPDCDEALKWYKMAAESGNTDAENKIKEIENGVRFFGNSLIQSFRNEGKRCK